MDLVDTFTAAQIRELRLLRREREKLVEVLAYGYPTVTDWRWDYRDSLAERIAELEKLLEEGK